MATKPASVFLTCQRRGRSRAFWWLAMVRTAASETCGGKRNDAPTRMVRQGYFGAVARTFGVAAAAAISFLFSVRIRSQSAIGC